MEEKHFYKGADEAGCAEYKSKGEWSNDDEGKDLISDIYDVIACNTDYITQKELFRKLDEVFEFEVEYTGGKRRINLYRKGEKDENGEYVHGYRLELKKF